MPTDPFSLKRLSKTHPRRFLYVAWSRYQDWVARRKYGQYSLPLISPTDGPQIDAPTGDTAVTPEQYRLLWAALHATEHLAGTRVVELGAFRGVTTSFLARHTDRPVTAIDPFLGYGGSAGDEAVFRGNIAGLKNVTHMRHTSGEARRAWAFGQSISLHFIDAVHDYANTRFDIAAWRPLVVSGGLIALHDVDQPSFAGTRRAAAELVDTCRIFGHVDNLAIFSVP
jgi:predicted O-methyltransferase YrrM